MAEKLKLKLGTFVGLSDNPEPSIKKVADFGLPTCQVGGWDASVYTDEVAGKLLDACARHNVEISLLWTGYRGKAVWNFLEGPSTLGLVPDELRAERVADLKAGADFAVKLGVSDTATHCGFIPEDPHDPKYPPTLDAIRQVAAHCKDLGIHFSFETGQETPVVLLRVIEDLGAEGLDNLGINLDPANLILYGKANPVDSLDVFGRYIRGVHAKDGLYPTNGRELGNEVRLGDGKVNFPVLIPKLKSYGYTGALTIEREISGEQQDKDIRAAIELLTPLL